MIIRIAVPGDAPEVQRIYAPYVLYSSISFELEVPTVDEISSRITNTLESHVWLIAEENGRLLGYAYASKHRERPAYQWSADVSVYLEEKAQGKGLGKKLYQALFEILRLQGFFKCFAGIALPNDKSIRLHEAFGFLFLGQYCQVGYKNGCWYDVGWWEKTLRQPEVNPLATKILAELDQTNLTAVLKFT